MEQVSSRQIAISTGHENAPLKSLPRLLSESIWQRGWRDTKVRIGSVAFWVVELVTGVAVPVAVSWLPTNLIIIATAGSVLSLALAVFVAALITAPIRQRDDVRSIARKMVPAFRVEFNETKPFVHRTILEPIKIGAIYVRVLPRPRSVRVMRCTGWLTGIEVLGVAGKFLPTDFHGTDSLQLKWSMQGDFALDPLDLIHGVQRFLDVLHVHEHCDRLLLDVSALPNWLADITKPPGTYRLSIKVVSDDGVSDEIQLVVKWTGKWDELAVRASESPEL